MPAETETCSNCKFYRPTNDPSGKGICRANPPIIILVSAMPHTSGWPTCLPTDWCGHWAKVT